MNTQGANRSREAIAVKGKIEIGSQPQISETELWRSLEYTLTLYQMSWLEISVYEVICDWSAQDPNRLPIGATLTSFPDSLETYSPRRGP
jgi:hypothetical protein